MNTDDIYHPTYQDPDLLGPSDEYSDNYDPMLDELQHPGMFNAYEESSISTVSTARQKRRQKVDDALKADPGFCSIVRNINNKKVSIRFYHTRTTPGSTIRNAVTGLYETNHRVGSRDEDFFFKVCNSYGYKDSRDPYILFFDSPEQYERLFLCSLPASIKETWILKVIAARAQRQSETTTKQTMVVIH